MSDPSTSTLETNSAATSEPLTSASTTPSAGTTNSSTLTEVIAALEDKTWQVLSRNGADLLPFLAPDCIMAFPFGMKISASSDPSISAVMTSDAFVPWKSYTMREVVVTPVGAGGAVISYHIKASRPDATGKGRDDTFRALISSVWRKDETHGTWEMCFHQQTPFDHSIEDIVE